MRTRTIILVFCRDLIVSTSILPSQFFHRPFVASFDCQVDASKADANPQKARDFSRFNSYVENSSKWNLKVD